MFSTPFLPHLQDLVFEEVTGDADQLVLLGASTGPTAVCPRCQQVSRRVHSH